MKTAAILLILALATPGATASDLEAVQPDAVSAGECSSPNWIVTLQCIKDRAYDVVDAPSECRGPNWIVTLECIEDRVRALVSA